MNDKPSYNCHTHTFAIDHVPNEFGKKLIPFLYKIITIRVIKWYYLNLTMKNERYRRFIHIVKKIRYGFIDVLKCTIVLQWINVLVCFVFRWLFGIITHFVRIDFLFQQNNQRSNKKIQKHLEDIHYIVNNIKSTTCWSKRMSQEPVL